MTIERDETLQCLYETDVRMGQTEEGEVLLALRLLATLDTTSSGALGQGTLPLGRQGRTGHTTKPWYDEDE